MFTILQVVAIQNKVKFLTYTWVSDLTKSTTSSNVAITIKILVFLIMMVINAKTKEYAKIIS